MEAASAAIVEYGTKTTRQAALIVQLGKQVQQLEQEAINAKQAR